MVSITLQTEPDGLKYIQYINGEVTLTLRAPEIRYDAATEVFSILSPSITSGISFRRIDVSVPSSVDDADLLAQLTALMLFPLQTSATVIGGGDATFAEQQLQTTRLTNLDTNIGAKADAPAGSDIGNFSVLAFVKRGLTNWTTLLTRIPLLQLTGGGNLRVSINESITVPVSGTVTAAFSDSPHTVLVDDTSTPNTTYIGKAVPGTLGASASWQIQQIVTTVSGTEIKFAGAGAFTQIWNNRTGLIYT